MKKDKQIKPISGKRYWLDSRKDISGVYSPNYQGQSRFKDIEGDSRMYLSDNDGAIRFPDGYFKHIIEV